VRIDGPGNVSIGDPPSEPGKDWVALVLYDPATGLLEEKPEPSAALQQLKIVHDYSDNLIRITNPVPGSRISLHDLTGEGETQLQLSSPGLTGGIPWLGAMPLQKNKPSDRIWPSQSFRQ